MAVADPPILKEEITTPGLTTMETLPSCDLNPLSPLSAGQLSVRDPSTPPAAGAKRSCRRSRSVTVLLILLATALATGIGALLWWIMRTPKRPFPGPYDVVSGAFDVAGGYTCGGSGTLAYYPAGNFSGDDGTFPVVIYAHGMEGFAAENLITAVKNVASFGFVLLAPNTSGTRSGCSSKREWKDLVLVAQQEKTVARFFQYVGNNLTANFSKLAVWGRSMGGKTVADALAQERRPFSAAVLQNGGRRSHKIKTPSMYLTATKDTSSSPPDIMRKQFAGNRAHHKVFVNVRGGYHILPPDEEKQMNTWMASFLHCHLSDRWDDCAKIYDEGYGTICTEPLLAQCNVSRNGSVAVAVPEQYPRLPRDTLDADGRSATSSFLA